MNAQVRHFNNFDEAANSFGGGRGSLGNSGEPPHNGGMEARLSALEIAVKELPTKADFAEFRFELRTDMAGTRADIAKSQSEMHKAIADNHRWTHGAIVGMFSIAVIGIGGLLLTIWNASKPASAPNGTPASAITQPVQQPPIIINVPGPSASPSQEK